MVHLYDVDVREQFVRSVDFVCPKCGLDRVGSEVQPRRWMTAFHLPVAPLGDLPRVVRCDDCEHAADPGVLDVPTTEQLTDLLEKATIAAAVIAVRSSSGERVSAVCERAEQLMAASGYEVEQRRFADMVAKTPTLDALDDIRRLRNELTPHGKQNFLHRLTSVVMSDGSLTTKQREALLTIGRALGMALPHVHGILAVAGVHAAA